MDTTTATTTATTKRTRARRRDRIEIRATTEESATLAALADAVGLPLARWIREAALSAPARAAEVERLRAEVERLRRQAAALEELRGLLVRAARAVAQAIDSEAPRRELHLACDELGAVLPGGVWPDAPAG